MPEDNKKKLIQVLRTLADELEAEKKPCAVVAAWVLAPDDKTIVHNSFFVHSKINNSMQINAWRSEASRVMRLMDQVDDLVKKNDPPPVFN